MQALFDFYNVFKIYTVNNLKKKNRFIYFPFKNQVNYKNFKNM